MVPSNLDIQFRIHNYFIVLDTSLHQESIPMSSWLNWFGNGGSGKSFMRWFGAKHDPIRTILIGLDAAGKTTLLYKLSRGAEVTTTIPTIGFNVETIELSKGDFVCWDVGGCDKIRPLWRHYFQNKEVMIVMVDSNDRDRMEALHEEMMMFAKENCLPLLILANKQDLPNAMNIQELTQVLHLNSFTDRYWEIMPICATSGEGLDGFYEALHRVARGGLTPASKQPSSSEVDVQPTLEPSSSANAEGLVSPPSSSAPAPTVSSTSLDPAYADHQKKIFDAAWEDWTSRLIAPDNNDDAFIQQLLDFQLDIWDHYTHVRIAYIYLLRHGWEEGSRLIRESLANFIANSHRTAAPNGGGGRSFHYTMTNFWCAIIFFWIRVHTNRTGSNESDFPGFLRFVADNRDGETNLVDKGLFRQYYSNSVIFGEEAKRSLVAPDLKELPVYI